MGIVNDYINKILNKVTKEKIDPEKPWTQFYKDMSVTLNYFQGSMYDNLKETASANSSKVAYRYFGTECTFNSFIKKIDRVAEALKQFDIVENECVTICMPNTPESFQLIYAINKIGAIANIVHPLSSTADIERALTESNSNILFASDVSMAKARDIKVEHFVMVPTSNSFNNITKILYNLKEKDNLKLTDNIISWEQFISYRYGEDTHVYRNASDPAAIIYSGGTTGKPKGIIISNGNFNAMAMQTRNVCEYIRPGHSVLAALPIFHVFGLALCCHTCLVAGMTCIIVPRLNTKKLNKELKKYRPNVFPAVPSMLRLCLNGIDPGKDAFKDIEVTVVGGDYLPDDLKHDFEKYLKDHGSKSVVKVGYGLSEATGFACCTAKMDEKDVYMGTLGIPNSDVIIKAFEPNSDIPLEFGQIGELCINGPTVMMGYINEDEETKKTLVAHNDGKIWLHTGDLGYLDEKGRVFYTSRLKRMIISNGYNIYPIELENIISKCEYVASVTVVGVPHKTKGQTPKAVIVLKDGFEATAEIKYEIKEYCKKNLANYAIPSEYEYRKDMPFTAVGKVAYRELQDSKEKTETKKKTKK